MINIEILAELSGNKTVGLVELSFHILKFKPLFHDLFLILGACVALLGLVTIGCLLKGLPVLG